MIWSFSTHNLFRRCQRRYFFSAIMASRPGSDPLRQEATFLKRLQSVQLWRGKLVHEYVDKIRSTLRNGWPLPPLSSMAKEIKDRTTTQFQFSARKGYRDSATTRDSLALIDHEYDRPLAEGVLEDVQKIAISAIRTFLAREKLIRRLKEPSTRTEYPVASSMGEDRLQARLDLFIPWKRQLWVVDLKVEEGTSDHRMQLQVYAYLLLRQPGYDQLDPNALNLFDWNLLSGKETKYAFTRDLYEETEDFIFSSLREMRHASPDHRYRLHMIEDFSYTQNPRNCEYCPFQRLCTRLSNEKVHDQRLPDHQPAATSLLL